MRSQKCYILRSRISASWKEERRSHQTKNAFALVNKEAALYVKDSEAIENLIGIAIQTVKNTEKLTNLSKNISKLAFNHSADTIADEVIKLAEQYKKEHGC